MTTRRSTSKSPRTPRATTPATAPSFTVLRNGERIATVTEEALAHAIAGTYCADARSARIVRNPDRRAVARYCYGHRDA